MKAGPRLASMIVSHCLLAWFLTLGSANYRHRHEHRIQRKYFQHPWFRNNSVRFCAFNQYLDEHEGRCMIIPGGGTALSIDDNTTCETEALRPHPVLSANYYACRRTKTILAECRGGQRFENRLKRCAIDVNSSADDFSGAADAPGNYDHISLPACERPGRFPIPQENCTLFYACTSNGFRLFRTIYTCPPSTGFDPITRMCSPKFACDKDGESNAESSTTKPESKFTTNDPRDAELIAAARETTTEIPSTSTTPPFNLSTEDEFIKTTIDGIIGAYQLSTLSTTQEYEDERTTPSINHEATFRPEDVPTSEKPFTDESNGTDEISTERSSTGDERSTTTSLNVSTDDDDNYENQMTLSTSSEYFRSEAKAIYTTLSYFSQDTSESERLLTTGKWLFDLSPTEDSTTTEATAEPVASTVDSRFAVPSTLFTTAELEASTESSMTETADVVIPSSVAQNEATTTSDEIPLNPSGTTVTSEPSIIVEDSAVTNDVTATATGENGSFDLASTEESSAKLLATTEAAPTSDRGTTIQDAVTSTMSLPGTESVSASSEASSIDDSVTTIGEWETSTSNIPSSIQNVITTTPIVDEYTNPEEFLQTTTENGASSGVIDAEDDKINSTTVPSAIGDPVSESTTIAYEDKLGKSETTSTDTKTNEETTTPYSESASELTEANSEVIGDITTTMDLVIATTEAE